MIFISRTRICIEIYFGERSPNMPLVFWYYYFERSYISIRVGGPIRKIKSGIEFWPEKTQSGRPDKNEARKDDSNVGQTRKPQPYFQ